MSVRVVVAIVVLAGVTGACAKPKVAPAPPRSDMIVLVPDPEDGRVGSVTVSAGGSSVDLATANHATRVAPGRAPTAPAPMAPEEVQRIFGETMSARPLQPKQYLLYFESGGDTLTADSQALLPEIVAFVRARRKGGDRGAATLLGMNPSTLRSRMKALGVKAPAQIQRGSASDQFSYANFHRFGFRSTCLSRCLANRFLAEYTKVQELDLIAQKSRVQGI